MGRGIASLSACILLGLALVSVRHVFGDTTDFYSAVWLPGHVMLHGGDPYRLSVIAHADPKSFAQSPFPVYGPPHLLIAMLTALLPLRVAAAVWGLLLLATVLLLGATAARAVGTRRPTDPLFWAASAAITAVLILSRPGRDALDLGQPSLLYVVAAMAAWQYRDRPWICGAAVALTLGKPPFAIPLVLLLAAARCWPALIRGLGLGVAVSVPVLAALAVDEGSISGVLQAIRQNATFFQDHFSVGGVSTRIEAASLVDRVFGYQSTATSIGIGVLVLGLGMAVVERARRNATRGAADSGPLLTVVALTTILAVAHQDYDLLLLAVPLAMVLRDRRPAIVLAAVVPGALLMMVPARTAARVLHTGPGTVLGLTTAFLVSTFVALLLSRRSWLRPDVISLVSEPSRSARAGRAAGSAAR